MVQLSDFLLVQFVLLVFCAGMIYAKLLNIGDKVKRMDDHGTRLTRIEDEIKHLNKKIS